MKQSFNFNVSERRKIPSVSLFYLYIYRTEHYEYVDKDGVVLDFYYLNSVGMQKIMDDEICLTRASQTFWFLPLPFQKVLRRKIAILQGHQTQGVLITDRISPDYVSEIGGLAR